jgi:hypothetical protein
MSTRFIQGIVILGLGLSVSEASAQGFPEFGHAGTVALGAERLMGLSFASAKTESASSNITYFSVLGSPAHATPYDVPRITFDYFVAQSFSMGTGLTVASIAPEQGDNTTFVAFSPRLGAGIPAGAGAGVWFRGGITYYSTTSGDYGINGLGLNLDAMFAIAITQSFAFTFGPVADIGLSGTADLPGGEADYKFSGFGANAGLAGFF